MTHQEKLKLLRKAAEPLIEFMNENCCAHDIVLVEIGHVSLFNGEIGIPFPIPD